MLKIFLLVMKLLMSAPVTTAAISPPAPPPPSPVSSPPPVSDDLYAAWTKVAICEEGGWRGRSGPAFPNSLGITAANWYGFGGGSDYSPAAQIVVAERLRAYYHIAIPDQTHCHPGGW